MYIGPAITQMNSFSLLGHLSADFEQENESKERMKLPIKLWRRSTTETGARKGLVALLKGAKTMLAPGMLIWWLLLTCYEFF